MSHSEGHPERFTELHGEEKMEEGDRGDQEEKRGNQKGREQSSQVINSLFALHSLEHSERFTDFHREEKMEEGDRGDQEERREERRGSQKERDQSSL